VRVQGSWQLAGQKPMLSCRGLFLMSLISVEKSASRASGYINILLSVESDYIYSPGAHVGLTYIAIESIEHADPMTNCVQQYGDDFFVHSVYSKNANVAVRDCDGLLALHHAVLRNNQQLVDILLSHTTALTVG